VLLLVNWQTRPVVGALDSSVCGGGCLAAVSESLCFLCSERGFQLASGCDVEDRIAGGGLRVGVVPDAVSASDDGVCANAVWLGFDFDFVA
jgi:hypothetical protein